MSEIECTQETRLEACPSESGLRGDHSGTFKTTQWNVVSAAGYGSEQAAQRATEILCRAYWFPLYAYVRRHGYSPEDSQDLTQEFFARCLTKNHFGLADQKRGRFRTFLLSSFKHFLIEEWRRSSRQKRGGGQALIHLDGLEAENRFVAVAGEALPPDRAFERDWAEALLQRVLEQLRADCTSTGRGEMYGQLQQFVWGAEADVSYAQIAERLHMNEGAVKVAVHRLRRRFRDLLREELKRSVANPSEVDDELRHILQVFSN